MSFSQTISTDTIIPITLSQLRTTNLIFAEHDKLSREVPLLKEQIANLDSINYNLEKIDSLRLTEIDYYKTKIQTLERKSKWWNNSCSLIAIIMGVLWIIK